jgi:hypothetical protein
MASFTAQVSDFVLETEARTVAVFKQSGQELFSIMLTPVAKGGNLPVDTGFLRNSFVSGINGATALTPPDSVSLSFAGVELGDEVFGGFTASYARYVEYGANGRTGRRFVALAALQWQEIVNRNAAALANR